jgi:hypothetical protein
LDAGAIERLGEAMAHSRAQEASIAMPERPRGAELSCERERDRDASIENDLEREREDVLGLVRDS